MGGIGGGMGMWGEGGPEQLKMPDEQTLLPRVRADEEPKYALKTL